MPPRSNVPIRICGSKTRTGCKTCKQRHVKCDEGRPVCSRCQKAHRQCIYEQPGEQNILVAGQDAGVGISVARQSRSPRVSPGLDTILSSYGPREALEVSAIKSFAVQVGKELAGCFSTDVWCRILPRVAQHEPSIWHALVAVSTLDTHLRLGRDRLGGDSHANTAIKHYSTAIRELSLRLGSGKSAYCKDVVLLTCLLFAIFECLQGHYSSALRHITGGMKLLMEWDHEARSGKRASPGGYFDHTSLQPMFLALDSQAIQIGANNFQEYFTLPAIGSHVQVPTLFPTIEAAHLSLNHIFNRLSRWSYWVEPDLDLETKPDDAWIVAEGQRLGLQLTQWDLAFQTLLDITNHQQPAIFLLLTQRKVLQAYYHKTIDGWSEMEWDKSISIFREAVEYAETYMQLTTSAANQSHKPNINNNNPRPRPVFTVAMDIVLSLYLICVKCRDSVLRRRALSMLQVCDRKEGIWDSQICAAMAAKIIAFEEKGALEDGFIPESARIFRLVVRMHEEEEEQGTGLDITHQKLISEEDGSQRIEKFDEDIAW